MKVLRFFVKKKYLEEIEGDMEEIFLDNVEQYSLRKAKRMYTWEMMRLMRPILIKNLEALQNINQISMFQNYFKISMRGLMKNPVNSFINIIGLTLAIAICVFGYGFARWTFSTDQFHVNKNEVFLVTFFADRDGKQQQYGKTPRPLGEMLKEDFTHIKKVCRVEDRNVVMKHGDNTFHQRIRFTDPEFLDMFTFPLKEGTASSLKDINSIILSEPMAIKYFGDENPIGQTILMIFGKDHNKVFKVTGVAKDFPKSRTISFDFLANYDNLRVAEPGYNDHDWTTLVNATLIQVETPSALQSIKPGMEKYRTLQNEASTKDWHITAFGFEPLATLHKQSEYITDDISRSSRSNYVSIIFMVVIGLFILALACANYINIAIVTAAKRLKEIGVRKSIGATRKAVIVQFLSENLIITFFALVLGVTLTATFFIPSFERLFSFSMDFSFADPTLWIVLPAILLLTSIASGIYPSLYISRFQVAGILKGSVRFGQKNPLTKVFLCFQLIMACIFICCTVVFVQNGDYIAERPWGYNQNEVLYTAIPDENAYEELSALLAQHPDIVNVSGSTHHLGKGNIKTILHFPEREYEVDQLAVGAGYFETLDLTLIDGRFFNDHEGSDKHAVVVNETLVKNMVWESPLGQRFRIDSIDYEVIGVVKDFHSFDFSQEIRPTIFTVAAKENYRFLSVKARSGSEPKVYKAMQEKWSQLFPEIPFSGGHQEDVWGFFFEQKGIYALVWRTFVTIVVTLATLGLYGLIRLNVSGRTKEFSIRKVLGADVVNIASSITRPYLTLFIVALLVGAPSGYFLSKSIIAMTYKYYMPMTFTGPVLGVVILVVVLLVTISTQMRKVLKSNPVDGLNVE